MIEVGRGERIVSLGTNGPTETAKIAAPSAPAEDQYQLETSALSSTDRIGSSSAPKTKGDAEARFRESARAWADGYARFVADSVAADQARGSNPFKTRKIVAAVEGFSLGVVTHRGFLFDRVQYSGTRSGKTVHHLPPSREVLPPADLQADAAVTSLLGEERRRELAGDAIQTALAAKGFELRAVTLPPAGFFGVSTKPEGVEYPSTLWLVTPRGAKAPGIGGKLWNNLVGVDVEHRITEGAFGGLSYELRDLTEPPLRSRAVYAVRNMTPPRTSGSDYAKLPRDGWPSPPLSLSLVDGQKVPILDRDGEYVARGLTLGSNFSQGVVTLGDGRSAKVWLDTTDAW